MWPNWQFCADLFTFTEEILNGKLHFCIMYGMTVRLKLVKITWCLLFSVKNWIKKVLRGSFFRVWHGPHSKCPRWCYLSLLFSFINKILSREAATTGVMDEKVLLEILQNSKSLSQVFSCKFCEISKNTFFTEHLLATASISRERN